MEVPGAQETAKKHFGAFTTNCNPIVVALGVNDREAPAIRFAVSVLGGEPLEKITGATD